MSAILSPVEIEAYRCLHRALVEIGQQDGSTIMADAFGRLLAHADAVAGRCVEICETESVALEVGKTIRQEFGLDRREGI